MEGQINVLSAKVVANQPQAKDIWELTLNPGIDFDVTTLLPGQFVCFEPLDQNSAMARPFSVARISPFSATFSVLYKVVGANTAIMSQLKDGQKIKFWGPLGQGFLPDFRAYNEVWLIGGGIGIAPLLFYDKVITEKQRGCKARVFYGGQTKDDIIPLNFMTEEPVVIATDDGAMGHHGFVTEAFKAFIKAAEYQNIMVITCGPNIMMQKVAEICFVHDIRCYLILERIMACGINSCKGCSIKTKSGMKRVCHDGPVFPAEEVIWDELS